MVNEPVRGRLPDPSFWSLSGMEQARAQLRGLVPRSPLSHLTGLRLAQVGAGSATVTMPASPWLQSSDSAIEVRILLEEALGVAVTTGAPAGHQVRTTALSVHQLRPSGVETDTFVGRARTLNTGSLFTLGEVQVEDGLGRAVAHGTGSFLIRPLDPPPPPPAAPLHPAEEPVYRTPDPFLRPLTKVFPFRFWEEHDALTVARRILTGELPPFPIMDLLGVRLLDVGDGFARWGARASEWWCSRSGDVSAGVVGTIAFFALGGAVVSVVPAGHAIGTVEHSITFLRPVPADGRDLLCHGTLVHHGDDLVVSTVEVTDAEGNRLALGYQTGVIRKRRPPTPAAEPERILTTVLFSDIVGSTERAEKLGDTPWRELLNAHHAAVRKELDVFKGTEIKTTGDGFLATFDSPGRAVQAARGIRAALRRLGLEVRIGLHTGECEVSGADVAGIAVHIASRVQSLAGDGEVLVTSTVRDLVTGSGLRFTDRGRQHLKGIEGDWQLFALAE